MNWIDSWILLWEHDSSSMNHGLWYELGNDVFGAWFMLDKHDYDFDETLIECYDIRIIDVREYEDIDSHQWCDDTLKMMSSHHDMMIHWKCEIYWRCEEWQEIDRWVYAIFNRLGDWFFRIRTFQGSFDYCRMKW